MQTLAIESSCATPSLLTAIGLIAVARDAGVDPVTLRVLSRHSPAGSTLLQLAPLPSAFSHSSLAMYRDCPLRYAFSYVYGITVDDRKGFFEFGTTVHTAFEGFMRACPDARAAGLPSPGFETLQEKFAEAWDPRRYVDQDAATHYERRTEPLLRRFYERELRSPTDAIAFEQGFEFDLPAGDGEPPVRLRGSIDRIDRHSDGGIEVIDYKTGGAKGQAAVDRDEQLSMYALALRSGAVRDAVSGSPLTGASRLTLYFAESDLAVSTSRTDEQLDAFAEGVIATARRIRSGDFAAAPDNQRCFRCDYRRLCPRRWEEA